VQRGEEFAVTYLNASQEGAVANGDEDDDRLAWVITDTADTSRTLRTSSRMLYAAQEDLDEDIEEIRGLHLDLALFVLGFVEADAGQHILEKHDDDAPSEDVCTGKVFHLESWRLPESTRNVGDLTTADMQSYDRRSEFEVLQSNVSSLPIPPMCLGSRPETVLDMVKWMELSARRTRAVCKFMRNLTKRIEEPGAVVKCETMSAHRHAHA
jgi:hypothetical protein